MRVAINLDTRRMVSWGNSPLDELSVTRNDRLAVELRFIRGSGFVSLQPDSVVTIGLKQSFAGSMLANAVGVLAGSGRNVFYAFDLNLNTVELNELFSSEPASVALSVEVEWSVEGAYRVSSIPVGVVVSNEYIREAETAIPVAAINLKATQADAEAGESNEKWMTPLRTRQASGRNWVEPPAMQSSLKSPSGNLYLEGDRAFDARFLYVHGVAHPPVRAALTLSSLGKGLVFSAKSPGVQGNQIQVEIIRNQTLPPATPCVTSTNGNKITVGVRSSQSEIFATWSHIKTALGESALVDVSYLSEDSANAIASPFPLRSLRGGLESLGKWARVPISPVWMTGPSQSSLSQGAIWGVSIFHDSFVSNGVEYNFNGTYLPGDELNEKRVYTRSDGAYSIWWGGGAWNLGAMPGGVIIVKTDSNPERIHPWTSGVTFDYLKISGAGTEDVDGIYYPPPPGAAQSLNGAPVWYKSIPSTDSIIWVRVSRSSNGWWSIQSGEVAPGAGMPTAWADLYFSESVESVPPEGDWQSGGDFLGNDPSPAVSLFTGHTGFSDWGAATGAPLIASQSALDIFDSPPPSNQIPRPREFMGVDIFDAAISGVDYSGRYVSEGARIGGRLVYQKENFFIWSHPYISNGGVGWVVTEGLPEFLKVNVTDPARAYLNGDYFYYPVGEETWIRYSSSRAAFKISKTSSPPGYGLYEGDTLLYFTYSSDPTSGWQGVTGATDSLSGVPLVSSFAGTGAPMPGNLEIQSNDTNVSGEYSLVSRINERLAWAKLGVSPLEGGIFWNGQKWVISGPSSSGGYMVKGAPNSVVNGLYVQSGTANGKPKFSNGIIDLFWSNTGSARWMFDRPDGAQFSNPLAWRYIGPAPDNSSAPPSSGYTSHTGSPAYPIAVEQVSSGYLYTSDIKPLIGGDHGEKAETPPLSNWAAREGGAGVALELDFPPLFVVSGTNPIGGWRKVVGGDESTAADSSVVDGPISPQTDCTPSPYHSLNGAFVFPISVSAYEAIISKPSWVFNWVIAGGESYISNGTTITRQFRAGAPCMGKDFIGKNPAPCRWSFRRQYSVDVLDSWDTKWKSIWCNATAYVDIEMIYRNGQCFCAIWAGDGTGVWTTSTGASTGYGKSNVYITLPEIGQVTVPTTQWWLPGWRSNAGYQNTRVDTIEIL